MAYGFMAYGFMAYGFMAYGVIMRYRIEYNIIYME